jgi:hypothetical protein
MKKINISLGLAVISLCLMTNNLQAQVTIGSNGDAAEAAILDLKTQDALNPQGPNTDDNRTSATGGLILPRVKLIDLHTMEPVIPKDDPDWLDSAGFIRKLNAGLMVYNLTSNEVFRPGIYTWNGESWITPATMNFSADGGVSKTGDSVVIGGAFKRNVDFDNKEHELSLDPPGKLHMAVPVILSSQLTYRHGKFGMGKVLMSDNAGNVTWEDNTTSTPETPTGVLSAAGTTHTVNECRNKWFNTNTYIKLPAGRWMIMVTMLVSAYDRNNPNNPNPRDRYWLRSSFIRENETAPNSSYFIGSSYISGNIGQGYNIITVYVVLENKVKDTRFYYCIGQAEVGEGSNASVVLNRVASKDWGENSIVAFSLVDK